MKSLSTLLFALWMAAFGGPAITRAGGDGPGKPVATVNGQPITDADLKVRGKLMELEHQAYELRRRAMERLISERVVEQAAAGKGLTVEQYWKQEVDSGITEPTPAEVESFYLGRQDKFKQPLEVIRDQVAATLRTTRISAARREHLEKLREQSDVKVMLEPVRFPVVAGEAPRKGSAAAPVTIVEFTDYQCPYCKRSQAVLRQVLSRYGDGVSLVTKDLPLTRIHSEAQRAAEAARCAGEQGKYWEYHDALFAAARLTENSYPEIAASLGLDGEQLTGCLKSRKYQAQVKADLEEAETVGATSTPTFFVNGILVKGAQSLDVFTRLIDSELARSAKSK